MPILSQRGYAKHRGCRLSAVQKAIKTGRITPMSDGKIDSDVADRQWEANTSVNKGPRLVIAPKTAKQTAPTVMAAPAGDDQESAVVPADFREAERQEKWEKVRALRRQNRIADAELVLLGPINAWAAGMVIKARDGLMRIGPELRDRLAQESNPIRCQEILEKALLAALSDLAEYRPNVA